MYKPQYPIYCSHLTHDHELAKYKIAAEWTGGGFTELKTFGFANDECLRDVYQDACDRAESVHLDKGEAMGKMGIYLLEGQRADLELPRMVGLENEMRYLPPQPVGS